MPPQEDIAYDLGVILPPDDAHLLPKSYKGKKPKSGYGTRIHLKRFSLTSFFKKHGFPLGERYVPSSRFKTQKGFLLFLKSNLEKKNDQLVCFNQGVLRKAKKSWGHCAVVTDVGDKVVGLRDPDPRRKKIREVLLKDLYKATKNHYKGGIWVIVDKKEVY